MESLFSLLPLLCVTAYFVIAIVIFTVRTWRRGLPIDPEVEGRPASRLLGRYLRHYMMWVLAPYERLLVRLHISPNMVTLASLTTAFTSAVFLGLGHFAAGGWLYLITGMLDILDGRVARATHRVTTGGAFFDSVIDRYAELAVFSGLAYYYRDSWVLFVVLGAATGSVMVSYVRARGESLGVEVKIGAMQRPERLFYLGAMVAESPLYEALVHGQGDGPLHPNHPTAVLALVLLGISANATAVRRIIYTLRLLEAAAGPATASVATASVATASASALSTVALSTATASALPAGETAGEGEPDSDGVRQRPAVSVDISTRALLAPLRPVG